jgi:hypothetical protein
MASDCLHQKGTEGNVGYEHAIHYVQMNHIGAASFGGFYLRGQMAQVGR